MTLDAETLARALSGRLVGENRAVTALLSPSQPAEPGGVMVIETRAQLEPLLGSAAARLLGAVVVPGAMDVGGRDPLPCPTIFVAEPRLAFAQLSERFAPPAPAPHLSAHAVIDPGATLAAGVSVGASAVVGANVTVGAGCRIGAGCVIGEGATLGEDTLLHASVTLYPGVQLGARVILHSGVVVGADGFGYAFSPQGARKIHHLGTVVLEDDVEVGANSCIDRGTLGETRVGARSKIDNLCQIGHNVVIGPDCVIAGASAVGGSTVLERGVVLGGAVAVTDHVRIGAGARIGGRSGVTKSVPAGETWAGYPAKPRRKWVRELYLIGQLDLIWKRFKDDTRAEEDA